MWWCLCAVVERPCNGGVVLWLGAHMLVLECCGGKQSLQIKYLNLTILGYLVVMWIPSILVCFS